MSLLLARFRNFAGVLLLAVVYASPAHAGSYEAPLPAQLSTDPDLCAYAPCKEVMPGADSFSLRMGRPSYVEAYKGKDEHKEGRKREDRDKHEEHEEDEHKQLVGYVFLSTDIVDIPAYSGKPVVTLIGMNTRGIITGVRILKHSEPILLIGIPETKLTDFIRQFVGKFAGDKVEIGKARIGEGYIGIDAISGATVTVIAENQVVMRSAYQIAKQTGIIQAIPKPPAKLTAVAEKMDWGALVKEGSVQRLSVRSSDMGQAETGEPHIDMYFGYLNAPNIGRNILGEQNYRRMMADLKPGEHAIFIVASGTASFKGSGFVRGGIYDRILVAQDLDTFTFRDTDYSNLYGISAAGAPSFRESGVFIIRNAGFSAAYPWSLAFLTSTLDQETGLKTFTTFDREYWLPARYLEGGRPVLVKPDSTWLRVWKGKKLEIALFVLLLCATATVYAMRDRLVRRATRKHKRWVDVPKYLVWASSVGFAGFYELAQPSITHVLTWFHSLLYHWKWELFLSDPLIFIFWWFIMVTVFIWGRGLFCGWLCPYGALTELAHKVGGALGLTRFQFNLPLPLHDKLRWMKYGIFVLLFAISLYSIDAAEKLAEVEPFKSTFLVGGVWHRSWPFVLYWGVLFGLALFMERPFCKYLCPLGAGLAIPTTFRCFGLVRKAECETCHACQKGCGSLAIDDVGRIDQRECLLCLECQILYYDDHTCPPLSEVRRRRTKAGLPLTPIGADGYFIPIKPIGRAEDAPQSKGEDAGVQSSSTTLRSAASPSVTGMGGMVKRDAMPEAPHPGPADASLPLLRWLWQEVRFLLLPWGSGYWKKKGILQAAAIGIAVVVTVAWILAETGHIGPAAVIAWWTGWSVYEVVCRQASLPWIKEGPWWQRNFRQASLADIMAFVATKNLLIGAGLFALLHTSGVLRFLSALPALRWLH